MFGELLASLDYFERKTIALIVRIAYSPNYISVSIRCFVAIISSVVSVLAKLFEDHDIVMACSGTTGTYLPLADPMLEAQIRDFEQQWDDLVYMVIRTPSPYGWLDSLLFIDNYQDEWEFASQELKDGYVLSWTINQDYPICSDMGSIIVERTQSGGLIRRG